MNDLSTSPLPAATMALMRQSILILGGLAVGRGWVQPEDVEGVATLLIMLTAGGYGLYKTFTRQRRIKDAEAVIGAIPKGASR